MSLDDSVQNILPLIQQQTDKVELVKRANDVYRLSAGAKRYYLKTYTKDWYGANPADTGFHALHESVAWTILRQHGLSVPEVVYLSTDCDNPIARPCVLTRELDGQSLMTLMASASSPEQFALLVAVGDYLRQMHSITFPFAGYLSEVAGPPAPPDPGAWQHRCWSVQTREAHAYRQLQEDAPHLSPATYAEAQHACAQIKARLTEAYQPPRFTHGDCHAHQFFLVPHRTGWRVTGVLDMEVASAGDGGEDLLKLSLELAQAWGSTTAWWEALFTGYGAIPDFEAFRLRLLSVAPIEYGPPGKWLADQSRDKIVRRILHAQDWSGLFAPVV